MVKVTYVSACGQKTDVEIAEGDNLMQAAVSAGVDGIVGECGGAMMCATCHVYIDEAWVSRLPAQSEGEAEMLECATAEVRAGSRLGCQVRVEAGLEGLTVHLPESQQ